MPVFIVAGVSIKELLTVISRGDNMQHNTKAIITLMRNKLNNNSLSYEDKLLFFHEKGITLSQSDTNLYYLKNSQDNKITELSKVTDGIIFRGAEVVCYHGIPAKEMTLKDSTNGVFIWNQNTIFIQKIDGKKVYLYFDVQKNEWTCSDDKKPVSALKELILSQIYNILALDPLFTYELILVEQGDDPGLYLIGMYDNKKFYELEWKKTDAYAYRHNLKRPPVYAFEGLEKIESNDLPILAQDQTMNKILITTLE